MFGKEKIFKKDDHKKPDFAGRRKVLRDGVIGFTALATLPVIPKVLKGAFEITKTLSSPEYVEQDLLLANDLWDFLNVPTLGQLKEIVYNGKKNINLKDGLWQNVSVWIFGDSMNLANGFRYGSQGFNQLKSWGYDIVQKANNFFKRKKINNALWVQYNDAIPGSSTQGLSGNESPDGNIQLGNKDIQKQIVEDNNTPLIAIGVNGNNWRYSGEFALNLYQNNPKFKKLLDGLDLLDSNLSTIDKLKANGGELYKLLFEDHDLGEQVLTLFEKVKEDRRNFEEGFHNALSIVARLNKQRKKQGNLPEIKLIVTLPIDLQLRDIIPFVPEGAPRDERGSLTYGDIPNAKGAAYRITVSIYKSVYKLLKAHAKDENFPEMISIPFLGFESDGSNFAPDGHFSDKGENGIGNRVLQKLTDGAQNLFDKFKRPFSLRRQR